MRARARPRWSIAPLAAACLLAGGGAAAAQGLVAAVLPASRSVQVGAPASAFATVINTGGATATGCRLAPATPGLPAGFVFRRRRHRPGAVARLGPRADGRARHRLLQRRHHARGPDVPHSRQPGRLAGDGAGQPAPAPGIRIAGISPPAAVASPVHTVEITGPPGAAGSLLVVEGGLFTAGVPGGGFDLDPFEANTALAVSEVAFAIGPEGAASVPIAITRSGGPETGLE